MQDRDTTLSDIRQRNDDTPAPGYAECGRQIEDDGFVTVFPAVAPEPCAADRPDDSPSP